MSADTAKIHSPRQLAQASVDTLLLSTASTITTVNLALIQGPNVVATVRTTITVAVTIAIAVA